MCGCTRQGLKVIPCLFLVIFYLIFSNLTKIIFDEDGFLLLVMNLVYRVGWPNRPMPLILVLLDKLP